jgi:muramoyltetrapeptide carboxypeptidase
MPIKPPRLNPGDTIGVIAPASASPDPDNIDRALAALTQLGFRTRPGTYLRRRHGFLAGSDRERASDLMRAFTDPRVNAIICLRGGYGAARLLPKLDFEIIRSHPKVFVGYSDITSLHCAFLAKAGLISFHGPMMNSDFARAEIPEFTLDRCLKTLMQPLAPGSISHGYHRKSVQVLRRGKTAGRLVGGNLSILCATIGTPYQPPFRGNILFLEDLNEEPYRYDRMLTHLLNAGLLQQVAGIAIGINRDCHDPKASQRREYRQSLEDVLRDRLLPLKLPVVCGLPFGHVPLNATLPVGARAILDGYRGDLIIAEPAVA